MKKTILSSLLITIISLSIFFLITSYSQLKKNNLKLRLESGRSNIKGPGVIIRLQDGNNEKNIIHDTDLLVIVNELWASQAKAISINGERIIMNTAIRCAGPTILINEKAISSPFVIKTIGHPKTIKSALNIPSGHIQTLKKEGSHTTLSKETEIIIPKFKKTITDIKILELQ